MPKNTITSSSSKHHPYKKQQTERDERQQQRELRKTKIAKEENPISEAADEVTADLNPPFSEADLNTLLSEADLKTLLSEADLNTIFSEETDLNTPLSHDDLDKLDALLKGDDFDVRFGFTDDDKNDDNSPKNQLKSMLSIIDVPRALFSRISRYVKNCVGNYLNHCLKRRRLPPA